MFSKKELKEEKLHILFLHLTVNQDNILNIFFGAKAYLLSSTLRTPLHEGLCPSWIGSKSLPTSRNWTIQTRRRGSSAFLWSPRSALLFAWGVLFQVAFYWPACWELVSIGLGSLLHYCLEQTNFMTLRKTFAFCICWRVHISPSPMGRQTFGRLWCIFAQLFGAPA